MKSIKRKGNTKMMIMDIVNLLLAGKLGSPEEQEMIGNLILQLCELLDETVDREIGHLTTIRDLEKEVKRLQRISAIRKYKK